MFGCTWMHSDFLDAVGEEKNGHHLLSGSKRSFFQGFLIYIYGFNSSNNKDGGKVDNLRFPISTLFIYASSTVHTPYPPSTLIIAFIIFPAL